MFRKWFLRDGNVIVNLDQVQIIHYERENKRIYFMSRDRPFYTMHDKTPR
jgi:hypothetical protein